jgi:hypothetical protein
MRPIVIGGSCSCERRAQSSSETSSGMVEYPCPRSSAQAASRESAAGKKMRIASAPVSTAEGEKSSTSASTTSAVD